ncbi:flagellar assembly protein FliW [Microbacterium sp. APC 3901]|uniref:flagellar assembly protein FliW n=1 Tax=Microbacterium sp. APC 3901 TaxID=3035192 RepID=UPI0025B4D895|nr:flagellar assembly protein FliW [Microbacterium sp. APC 3901]MDN3443829.1 flagellar assembly protein FliW [Microbacterium sp. APC 3901]
MSASTDQRAGVLDVEFAAPMPGLSPHTAFTLEQIDGAEGLHALRATGADVRLFLLDPASGDYGYDPTIPAEVRGQIGAADDSDIRVFVVANPSADGVYINLRAPILIHAESGRAVQVILEDQRYPIRARLGG